MNDFVDNFRVQKLLGPGGLGLGFCVVSSVLGGNLSGFSWDFWDDRRVGCWVFENIVRI